MSSERHEKWVLVPPGTVIPAGQPYRIEFPDGSATEASRTEPLRAGAFTRDRDQWFIDSTWKPPLPTEPTWGIVIIFDGVNRFERFGKWALISGGKRLRGQRYFSEWRTEWIIAFVECTAEQVAEIEGAR